MLQVWCPGACSLQVRETPMKVGQILISRRAKFARFVILQIDNLGVRVAPARVPNKDAFTVPFNMVEELFDVEVQGR